MEYDPTQFSGTAHHYLRGRPPYSDRLGEVLTEELGLDGTGVLVDVGAGPGTVAAALGHLFERVVVVEPDEEMLAQARRHLAERGLDAVDFVRATAEDLPGLRLEQARLVTFGQSFHRVDRLPVTAAVHDLLEPEGALALVTHDYLRQPRGPLPSEPPVPHDEIRELVVRFTGELRSGGRSVASYVPAERFEETLAGSAFGHAEIRRAPGRTDIVRDLDGVIDGVLSMSYAAPALFDGRFEEFLDELRALLSGLSETGRFWDWPGDTEIVLARKR